MVVPAGVVTVTATDPAGPDGTTVVSWLSETTVNAAGTAPKATAVVAARLVPVMVTVFPPDSGPCAGLTAVTEGAGRYVYGSGLLVPPAVVTVTGTGPGARAELPR